MKIRPSLILVTTRDVFPCLRMKTEWGYLKEWVQQVTSFSRGAKDLIGRLSKERKVQLGANLKMIAHSLLT